ncbi:MAG: hypothetical protein DHS20C17_28650 [Cyclobacteriaceae bacterium]|nr:MAG: hypothetical protein DHS20C17_28650 [Cyclobacteriaceae bacterium]
MLLKSIISWCIFLTILAPVCIAQDQKTGEVLTYEGVNDDPYAVNKLFIHIQPVYGELFATNVNLGFGLQVDYQIARGLGLTANWRHPYARQTDFAREVAFKNQDNIDNNKTWNYLEFGGTIHLSDHDQVGKSKIILYSKRYKGNKWANKTAEKLIIPSRVRKVMGFRWGGMMYNSTIDISNAAEHQNIGLVDEENNSVDQAKLYGNIDVKGIYAGLSLQIIKNVAIKPHRDFGVLVNDLHFNAFIDVMYAPSINLEDIILDGQIISGGQLQTQELGFRAGIQGKFNKPVGFSYGGEFGYRPGLKDLGFYSMFKLGFPVFGIPPKDLTRNYR